MRKINNTRLDVQCQQNCCEMFLASTGSLTAGDCSTLTTVSQQNSR